MYVCGSVRVFPLRWGAKDVRVYMRLRLPPWWGKRTNVCMRSRYPVVGVECECISSRLPPWWRERTHVCMRSRLSQRWGKRTNVLVCGSIRGSLLWWGKRTHLCVCVRDVPGGGGRGRTYDYVFPASPVVKGEDEYVCMRSRLPPLGGERIHACVCGSVRGFPSWWGKRTNV